MNSDDPSNSLLQSPALANGSFVANAYELKCVISECTATTLVEFLRDALVVDPFAQAASNGFYRITTLSTDTSDLSCFHRVPGYARRKYRVRRYDDEPTVYLERKTRRGNRVQKVRSAVPINELTRLDVALSDQVKRHSGASASCEKEAGSAETDIESEWSGSSFASQLARRELKPVCLLTYERQAWFGNSENGAIRFTLDRNLSGRLVSNWTMPPADSSMATTILTTHAVICEFKFHGTLPQIYKSAIQRFSLEPGGYSKYRNSMAILKQIRVTPEDTRTIGVTPCQNG